MDQRDSAFSINNDKKADALKALKELLNHTGLMSGGQFGGEGEPKRWFRWVDSDDVANAKTLEEALKAWRWETYANDKGDIVNIELQREKLGDDLVMFEAIAPFVISGSYIQMTGEDGSMWRWTFNGVQCVEQNATITWE